MRKLLDTIKSWFGNARFYFIIAFLFLIFAMFCFTWRIWGSLSFKLPINPEIWGQFGDFVGGTLGVAFSLISVMLVVWTFNTQNKTAETQRFNDLFFQLLAVLQAQEKELQYFHKDSEGNDILSDNKDFFFDLNQKLSENFKPSLPFSQNRKNAIKTYVDTVIVYKAKLSICYRTIFQILSLVENGSINTKEKKEYLKIFRSQLTESELLFLRYHIKSGDYIKFAYIVNKSNLMKHLPLFDLLEFKYWRDKLDPIEIKYANDFFISLFKQIRKGGNSTTAIDKSISATINKTKNSLCMYITKNPKTKWISKFSNKEFENLCEGVLKEIVMFSNYSCYNNYKDLVFSPAKTDNNTIIVDVHNKKDKEINVAFDNKMRYEDIKAIF